MLPRSLVAPVVLALALAACTSPTPVAGGDPPSPTASATDPVTPAGSTPPASGTPTDPSATPDPSAPGAPAPTGDGPGAVPAEPPAAGTYRYTQDGETSFGPFTFEPDAEGTLTVGEAFARGGTTRQEQTRVYARNDSREQILQFRPAGVFLLSVVTRFATTEQTCELDQPLLVVRQPPAVSAGWTDTSTCDDLRLRVNGSIVRSEQRSVGGAAVDTVVLRTVVRVTGDGVEQTVRSTAWISPEHRLIVASRTRTEGTFDGTPFTQRLDDELVSLVPTS